METVRIPNQATYSPIALTDLAIVAPLLSRVVLGATLPGRVLQALSLTAYAGSAIQDWFQRQGVRRIDFPREFGADLHRMRKMSVEVRLSESHTLADRINEGYTEERFELHELARKVDRHLTNYIAGITNQRVENSVEVRTFSFVQVAFPFALGAADILSGDISIFHDTGVFQPHVLAHEFAHRKGYWRELDAQALAYLSLTASGEDALVQAALCERLHRNLRVVSGDDEAAYDELVKRLELRPELEKAFLQLRPEVGQIGRAVSDAMRNLYDLRMRATGQNGISDYDVGFTNFLYSFETSDTARQRPPSRGALH